MKVLGFEFGGPHSVDANFNKIAGIYMITKPVANGHAVVVDVGETSDLSQRIPSHDRRDCWDDNEGGLLWFLAVASRDTRLEIEKMIRDAYPPTCGVK